MKNKVDFIIKINCDISNEDMKNMEKSVYDKYDNVLLVFDFGGQIEIESIKPKGVIEVDDVNDII